MDTFTDLGTGREYPTGSVGELHRQLDQDIEQMSGELTHLCQAGDAQGLDQMGAACQQAARRLAVIGVLANTTRVHADTRRQENK